MMIPDYRPPEAIYSNEKMAALLADLDAVTAAELSRADKKHSRKHNSPHEAYAVILEEFLEAREDIETLSQMMDGLVTWMRADADRGFIAGTVRVKEAALHAAAELVQVVAMCQKTARGFAVDSGVNDDVQVQT